MTRGDGVYVGKYFGERSYEITEEAVRHYCGSVGEDESELDLRDGDGRRIAPPLLLHSDVYENLGWYLPNIYGNLHARQEWQFFSPVVVGERVTTRSVIVDRYLKRNREYIANEVTYFGDDGRPVLRGRTHQSFLVETERRDTVVDRDREKRPERRFDVDETVALEKIDGGERVITLEMCRLFSGPRKNYHNDVEEAKKLGFPDIVVQGMMPLCFVADMLAKRYGVGLYRGGRMDMRLVNVLWNGDRTRSRGIVREVRDEGARQREEIEVWCEKEDGTKVVIGTASAMSGP